MFARPLSEEFGDILSLKGIYDSNPVRAGFYARCFEGMKAYDDFDQMLKEVRPDAVIVASKDVTHCEYIVKSLESGCDVVCEKPMVIDAAQCAEVREAERRTGRKVTVTFNCRFMPHYARVREIVASGEIGRPLAVRYEYLLGRGHGADYFRRWHSRMENAGGMFVHKATHHFDVANWIVGDAPVRVSAAGRLSFFGGAGASASGGVNCRVCGKEDCAFRFRGRDGAFLRELGVSDPEFFDRLYFDAERVDGYLRDKCVFSPDADIYDTMSANVEYRGGCQLSYTLSMYNPYEGYRLSVTGDKGRIDARHFDIPGEDGYSVRVFGGTRAFREENIGATDAPHGGGDALLREMVFRGGVPDPLGKCASSADGMRSIAVGVCANRSVREGRAVLLSEEFPEA